MLLQLITNSAVFNILKIVQFEQIVIFIIILKSLKKAVLVMIFFKSFTNKTTSNKFKHLAWP